MIQLDQTYPEYVEEEVAGSRAARSGTAQPAETGKEPFVPVLVVLVLHLFERRQRRDRVRPTLLVRELHFDLILLRLGHLLHLVRPVLRFRVHVLQKKQRNGEAFKDFVSLSLERERIIPRK